MLLAVYEQYLYVGIFFVQVTCQCLCRIYRAVSASGASECGLQVCESPFQIFLYGGVYQGAGVADEGKYLAVGFEEMRHGIVHPCKGGILGVSPGVVYGAAIEYKAAAVAALVAGDAHAV